MQKRGTAGNKKAAPATERLLEGAALATQGGPHRVNQTTYLPDYF